MKDVEAVPAVPDQAQRFDQCKRRAQRSGAKRTGTDDHRRPLRFRERLGHCLRQLAEQLQIVANPLDRHRQVDFGPDRKDLAALLGNLPQAGRHQRRFPSRVAADQQDRVGLLDSGDGRVEVHGRKIADVIIEAGLATFEKLRPQLLQQGLGRVHRLRVEEVAGDRRDLASGSFQLLGENPERLVPPRFAELAAFADPRPVEPVADQSIRVVAGLVANPLFIDVVIHPRKDPHHLPLANVEPDVGAHRVHYVDSRHPPELPRPHFENLRFLQQRADRADVGEVAGKLAGHRLLEIGRDLLVLAAIEHPDLGHARDFLGEADAARALDAPRHGRLDDRPHVLFVDRALVLLEPGESPAIGHCLVLEIAFAALVANRAVERVVDEQELHHPLARLLHHRRVGADRLAVGGGKRAARLRLGRAGSDLDEAHPAIAGDRQPLVIAEARDFLARELASLEDRRALRDLDLDAVDGDLRHRPSPHDAG